MLSSDLVYIFMKNFDFETFQGKYNVKPFTSNIQWIKLELAIHDIKTKIV